MAKRLMTIFISMILFLHLFILNVVAVQGYDFETIPLSNEEKNSIWNNLNLTVSTDCSSLIQNKQPIVSFDVSENKTIVLGLEENQIVVIDENKNLVLSFGFNYDGVFYVRWNDENILLMLVRGSIIVEFDSNGCMIDIIQTDDNNVSNNKLWNTAKKNEIEIEGTKYIARNKMGVLNIFSSTYSTSASLKSVQP